MENNEVVVTPVETEIPPFPSDNGGDFSYDLEPISTEQLYDVVYTAVYDAYQAQTVTDGQNISNTALEYFKGVLLNESPFIDYVCYVGDSYTYWWGNNQQTAYEYCMAYGDLELSGTYFTGNADIVKMRTSGENSVVYQTNQNISINAPMYYSRSNLGAYSGIVEKNYYGAGILIALLLGGCVWCVRKFLSGS